MDIGEVIEHKEALIFNTLEESINDAHGISDEMEHHLSRMYPEDDNFDRLSRVQDKLRYVCFYTGAGMYYAASCVKELKGRKPSDFIEKANYRAKMSEKAIERSEICHKVSDLRDKLAVMMRKYPDRFLTDKNRPQLVKDSIRLLDDIEEKLYEITIEHV